MTPKEKAEELVDKYYHLFSVKLENTIADYEAIECALIAVDEIITELVKLSNGEFTFIHEVEYWQEVKKEIKDLEYGK